MGWEMNRRKLLETATPIIEEIAEKRKTCGFAYLTPKDISQEIWCICLRALAKYNSKEGELRNYLNCCVSNGLKNLRRDRYYRLPPNNVDVGGDIQSRINLVNAIPLGGGDICQTNEYTLTGLSDWDPCSPLIEQEHVELVRSQLSPELQVTFDKVLDGESVSKSCLHGLLRAVNRVVKQHRDNKDA